MIAVLQVLACLVGIYGCIRYLAWLCRKPTYRQIGRFPGNDVAGDLYAHRRDALGHSTARNVRDKASA